MIVAFEVFVPCTGDYKTLDNRRLVGRLLRTKVEFGGINGLRLLSDLSLFLFLLSDLSHHLFNFFL